MKIPTTVEELRPWMDANGYAIEKMRVPFPWSEFSWIVTVDDRFMVRAVTEADAFAYCLGSYILQGMAEAQGPII